MTRLGLHTLGRCPVAQWDGDTHRLNPWNVLPQDPRATPLALPRMTAPTADADAKPVWALSGVTIASHWVPAWHLGLGGVTIMGREPGPEAGARIETIADANASRRHARLVGEPDRLTIEDLGSTNGTWVNGRRNTSQVLDPGDVIRIGDSVFVVTYDTMTLGGRLGGELVGEAGSMVRLRALITKVAPSTLPVLVMGPTGTGKELIARALHTESARRGDFVTLNCAALPAELVESALFGHRRGAFTGATTDSAGAFRKASGGTLLLDEVGEMPLEIQAKLLRALDPGEITPVGATASVSVDARVVAATNVPLLDAVSAGRFRADLYERLNGVILRAPPLAARRSDVPALFRGFVGAELCDVPVDADFAEALVLYNWPRNVRELKNTAERIAVLHPGTDRLTLEMLAAPVQRRLHQRRRRTEDLSELEGQRLARSASPIAPWPPTKAQLVALLGEADGNVSTVARTVGRNRKQVYRWMDQLGVARGTGRDQAT